ncbi:MAG: hypothetical protein WA160_03855 [Pseudobdellovibrio sp.]
MVTNSNKKYIQKVILVSIASITFGCSPAHINSIENASQNISDSLGCENVKSKMFDSFYELIDHDQFVPNSAELKQSINNKIDKLLENKNFSSVQKIKIPLLKKELLILVDQMLVESKMNPKTTWKEQIQKLIEYEMEDQSSVGIVQVAQNINSSIMQIKGISKSLQLDCASADLDTTNSIVPSAGSVVEPKTGKLSQGINMVFSTAYQSCRVLDLPAIDRSTASVVGISRVGTHPDGIGAKREITDLKSVQNTHYYIRGIASESQCADVKNNPLIYDYGGEPAISKNTINFQVNAGTGTTVLGVDCSAYISSTIAVAGLLYKPGVANKPIFIRQNSSKFIDAVKSGFSCFENITVSTKGSIKAADIIGVKGHVVAIDKVGEDPFGLSLIKKEADCATINYKNFDFSITQSSPSKNGIGINKYLIKDYLDESGSTGKMTNAFVGMARKACLAKFQNKEIKPSNTEWGFLRHKGTAECFAPRVTMVGEACIQKCF